MIHFYITIFKKLEISWQCAISPGFCQTNMFYDIWRTSFVGQRIAAALQHSIKTLFRDTLPLYKNCSSCDLDIALSHVDVLIISWLIVQHYTMPSPLPNRYCKVSDPKRWHWCRLAALVSGVFWTHFCTVGGGGEPCPIFICPMSSLYVKFRFMFWKCMQISQCLIKTVSKMLFS